MRSIRRSLVLTILCSFLFSNKQVFGKFDDILLKLEEEKLKKGYCQKINRRPKLFHYGNNWGNVPMNNDLCLDYCERTDKVEDADIVLWHVHEIAEHPENMKSESVLIAFGQETNFKSASQNNQRINYTSTFEVASDIPYVYLEHYFYEKIYKLPVPTLTEFQNMKNILFISSNCNVPQRVSYMKELMKHIQIDSLGSCLNNGDKLTGECKDIESGAYGKYKFYIGFDKNNDADYVTEKFTAGYLINSVPVYSGNERAYDYAPNSSFINIREYENPEDLARHLKFLSENYSEWAKYFNYRNLPKEPRLEVFSKWVNSTRFEIAGRRGNLCRYCDHYCYKIGQ